MKQKNRNQFLRSGILLLLFVIFTVLVTCIDVKPIGPGESPVGFAEINRFIFERIGTHLFWYHLTDWFGMIAILFAFGFATVGFVQLVKRKSVQKVDRQIILLGVFYLLVFAAYLFFEFVTVNDRPIILGDSPEASYPSSHAMIVTCIMVSSVNCFKSLCPKKKLCRMIELAAYIIITVTTIGRLISGVHWVTDIAGGMLLSAALLALYCAASEYIKEQT